MTRAKRRGKPHDPSAVIRGDHGPGTPAQRAGTRIEPVPEDANGMKRRVREGALEWLLRHRKISVREFNAGVAIRAAYEATLKSPPAIREIHVDASPGPDAFIAMQVDRQSEYARLMSAVPSDMRYVVRHVCCDDRAVRELGGSGQSRGMHKARLQVALMLVANELRC